jgi:hypothetical protein
MSLEEVTEVSILSEVLKYSGIVYVFVHYPHNIDRFVLESVPHFNAGVHEIFFNSPCLLFGNTAKTYNECVGNRQNKFRVFEVDCDDERILRIYDEKHKPIYAI